MTGQRSHSSPSLRLLICVFFLCFFTAEVVAAGAAPTQPPSAASDGSTKPPDRKRRRARSPASETGKGAEKKKSLNLAEVEDADLKASWAREARTRWTTPGLSISTPGGFGAPWGYIYTGLNFVNRTRYSKIADGAAFLGFGAGNPEKYLGLETTLVATDLDPFAKTVILNLKLHRNLPNGFAVAAGMDNAIVIGGDTDSIATAYVAATRVMILESNEMKPFSAVSVSMGVGNGRFRTDPQIFADKKTLGFFGSVGVRVLAPIGIATSWSGRDLDFGVSIAPFRSFRMVVTPAVTELTGIGGRNRAFSLTVSFGDSIFDETFPYFSTRNFK